MEMGWRGEVHALAHHGMGEGQLGGMQAQTVGLLSVEGIAQDGGAQPVGMRTVHAQLMGAPCVRREG